MSPLPYNEDERGSREIIYHGDPDRPRADNICSKRRKISALLGGGIFSCNKPSQLSPPLSEDEDSKEDNGTLSISIDTKLTSSSRTIPVSEYTSLTERQICPIVTDVDQD